MEEHQKRPWISATKCCILSNDNFKYFGIQRSAKLSQQGLRP